MQALAALLERNRASLYATAMRLLGSRADALDAVQDTSLIALARMSEVRDTGAARAWLHTVVRNVCLMQLRQRRELPCAQVDPHRTAIGPEEALAQHALREWVWRALETLPAEEQLTVILRYFSRCESYARSHASPLCRSARFAAGSTGAGRGWQLH